MDKLKRCCLGSKLALSFRKFMQWLSVGQVDTILFLNRKNAKSSTCGGITTLIWGMLVIAYAYTILASIIREETFYLSSTSKTVAYYQIADQKLPLSQAKYENYEDWASVTTAEFARLLSTSQYYLTQNRDLPQSKKCDEFKAEVRFYANSGWKSVVNTTFFNAAYSFQCALDMGRKEILGDLET